MTHCFLLQCCTKTHIEDYLPFVICIFFLFYVLISAFPLYFVAFCQRLIYEYMDIYGYGCSDFLLSLSATTFTASRTLTGHQQQHVACRTSHPQ